MFDLATFTAIHTALSLIALAAGVITAIGLFGVQLPSFWTTLFLITAVATSITGFGFPFHGVLPSHVVGALALVVLAATIVALYVRRRAGAWRWIYAVGVVANVYFLVFVMIAQAFMKIAILQPLAPTLSEWPFAVAQIAALLLFVAIGIAAARSHRADPILEGMSA